MTEFYKLHDLYSGFSLIDRDAPGGFARVWEVVGCQMSNRPLALKVMRPEVLETFSQNRALSKDPFEKFLSEVQVLTKLSQEKANGSKSLDIVTDIYDIGFLEKESVIKLLNSSSASQSESHMGIRSMKLDIEGFQTFWHSTGQKKQWLPYLVIELANYNDSLYRRIHRYKRDETGLYRFSTLEAMVITIRLLDFLDILHRQNIAYIDWKPEHIYWNAKSWSIKLIDFNVTVPLDEFPGKSRNIADDVRLLAGSALYSCLNLAEFDTKNIVPKPSRNLNDPAQESRNRYLISPGDELIFSSARKYIDADLRLLLSKIFFESRNEFLAPQELRSALLLYLEKYFGISEKTIYASADELYNEKNAYIEMLLKIHDARVALDQSFKKSLDLLGDGKNLEIKRLSEALNRMRRDFPIP